MRRSKITAAIITKNEEKNIAGCLDKLKGWADEVVIVDGYSDDRTTEIAANYGAKIVKHKFEGDFSIERNLGHENGTGDWILHLDADDRVTDEFKRACDDIIDADPAVDVYKFLRRNFFIGHKMQYGGFSHFIPNLTRRTTVHFEGRLHEKPVFKGAIKEINADIEHFPFDSIEQFVGRHNRYSSIEAARMFEKEGTSKLNEIGKQAVGRTLKLLWKMYVKKKGYKDGRYGLLFSVLFAFTNFLIWMKYWELCQKGKTT